MIEESDYLKLEQKVQELERELRITKSLNRSINVVVENSPAAIVITDKDGYIEYVNPTFSKISGYTEEEALGMHTRVLKSDFHPDEYYVAMWKTINLGNTWKDSFFNKKKNGEGYWEQQYIGPIKDDNGEITHFVAVKIDITLQKEFEQKLKANQEYLNAITKALPELVFIVDEDGFYKDIIAPDIDLVYQEIAQMKGRRVYDFMPKALADRFIQIIQITLNTREAQLIEYEMNVLSESRWFEGRSAPLDMVFEGKKSIVLIAYDITERKKSQQALKESEDRFRSIFESANTGITFSDAMGNIMFVNPTFASILGYEPDEMVGKNVNEFTHSEDTMKEFELIGEILIGKRDVYRTEKRYVKKNGDVIWADLSRAAVRNDLHETVYLVGMMNDITERVLAEKRMKELVITKDKFFSIIAHDLKNPFNALLGISELLYSSPEEYDMQQVKELSKLMNESSRNAYELLENLLQWSRSQTGQLQFKSQNLNLKELVENSAKIVEGQVFNKNIRLENLVNSEIEVLGDSNLLKTVFRNLISNAIKYTNIGGRIDIWATENTTFIHIYFKDSGVGISEESQKHLFQLEYKCSSPGTANEKGTGLGLILCKEFIEMHGGYLSVESTLGVGSCFTVSLLKSNNSKG